MPMDPRIVALGADLTRCPYRAECPGIRAGTVTNDPTIGVLPRGLLITPHETRIEDVRLVIVGLNPKRWDDYHRTHMARLTTDKSSEDAYEAINRFFETRLHTYPYNLQVERAVRATVGTAAATPRLYAELACCETAEGKRNPSHAEYRYCADMHLRRHLSLVPSDAVVMAVGSAVFLWLGRPPVADWVRWFGIAHPSAHQGQFARQFAAGTDRLTPEAAVRWAEFASGGENGVWLG